MQFANPLLWIEKLLLEAKGNFPCKEKTKGVTQACFGNCESQAPTWHGAAARDAMGLGGGDKHK